MKIVVSVGGVPIRLTEERLGHIERRHPELDGEEARVLETLGGPDYVQEGDAETLIALKRYDETPLSGKFMVVVYREVSRIDGFVVTAYLTREPSAARRTVWKR